MQLTLATRIFLGYAAVLVTFGTVSIFSVAEMHRNQLEIQLVSEGYVPLSQEVSELKTSHETQGKETQDILEQKEPAIRRGLLNLSRLYFPEQMLRRRQQLARSRERTAQLLAFAPAAEAPFIRDVSQRLVQLAARYDEYEALARGTFVGPPDAAPESVQTTESLERLKKLETSVRGDIRYLQHALESRIRERVEQAPRREQRTGLTIIGLSILAIAVGLIATAMSARTLRPVRALTEAVSRLGQGDFGAQLGLTGDDEIAALAREFDKMATSLKEKQDALLSAERAAAAGRVSAQIAHEVRNPLSSIGLNIEMLEEHIERSTFATSDDALEAKELLSSVHRELDRLTDITEQHLKMARLPQPTLAPENINEVLRSVLDFSREELARTKVDIVRSFDPHLARALADEGQLRQVFLNLLRNSREAMAQGGTLTVASRPVDGEIEVAFTDTGPGIAPEAQPRLFEPFFSTKPGGTGVGLFLSKQIVAAHGGSLACNSSPSGTTFVIRLPCA